MLKTSHIIFVLTILYSVVGNLYCQNNKPYAYPKLDQLLSLTNNKLDVDESKNTKTQNNKIIQIQQVGQKNTVKSKTISALNNSQILQVGEKNNIFQELIAGRIESNIFQTGYENTIFHVNLSNSKAHTATLIQYGLRQNLVWVGDNNLSQNMVVRMRGRNQTVLIRNRN